MADAAEKVVAIHGAVQSDKKAAWLDQVAQAYDQTVRAYGEEPAALFFVAVVRNGHRTSWSIDRDQNPDALLLLAGEALRSGTVFYRDPE